MSKIKDLFNLADGQEDLYPPLPGQRSLLELIEKKGKGKSDV